jgi:hypothetical protein
MNINLNINDSMMFPYLHASLYEIYTGNSTLDSIPMYIN